MVITGLTRKRLGLVTFIYPQSLETLHFFGILSADFSEVGRQFSIKIPTIRFHMESYLAYGENTHTLRLTSELVDLRVGYAKWIRTTSCPSQSISAPYEIENFIRRDIEVVITGLTRNQFVRKHTRVRIPLSPPKNGRSYLPFYLIRYTGLNLLTTFQR